MDITKNIKNQKKFWIIYVRKLYKLETKQNKKEFKLISYRWISSNLTKQKKKSHIENNNIYLIKSSCNTYSKTFLDKKLKWT